MSDKEIINVLQLAEKGELPARIDESSTIPITIVKELYESGLLDAIDASSNSGTSYLQTRINVNGREYLKTLKQQQYEASPQAAMHKIGVRIFDWLGGITTGLIIAWVSFKYFT